MKTDSASVLVAFTSPGSESEVLAEILGAGAGAGVGASAPVCYASTWVAK